MRGLACLLALLLLATPARAAETSWSPLGWLRDLFATPAPEAPPPSAARPDRAALEAAIHDNAVAYATLHATLKPCSPARDLRDRYLDTVERVLPFALGMAQQAYDIAYLSAPRGVSNCGMAGQKTVDAGTEAGLAALARLASDYAVAPAPAADPALPDWVRTGVRFATFLFADRAAALAACDAAEAGLRQGYLDHVGALLPEALADATARYDATVVRAAGREQDCAAETVAAGERHLQLILGELDRLAAAKQRRMAAPPSWNDRMATGYGACDGHVGVPDADCYCTGEAVANRAEGRPASLTAELTPAAARRCAQPQALRVAQYDRCIQVYGAFVEGAARTRAEGYCGCVAGYTVTHWRERPLPELRLDAIAACRRVDRAG